jgi:hypothetical protein
MAYLKQIFCDGSVTEYSEYKGDKLPYMSDRYLSRDGSEPIIVEAGYLQSKVDFLKTSGNSDKIIKWVK